MILCILQDVEDPVGGGGRDCKPLGNGVLLGNLKPYPKTMMSLILQFYSRLDTKHFYPIPDWLSTMQKLYHHCGPTYAKY